MPFTEKIKLEALKIRAYLNIGEGSDYVGDLHAAFPDIIENERLEFMNSLNE